MGLLRVLHEGARAWLPTSRARRYHAALATLLAHHRFTELDGRDKARIDADLVEIFKPYGIYPWWRYRRDASASAMAADRAIAMYRLGISTGIANLQWVDVLHPWHRQSPVQLALDFRAHHPATDEALQFLSSHGVASTELERFGEQWLKRGRARKEPAHDA